MGYRHIQCELVLGHADIEHRGHNVKWIVRWTVPKPRPAHEVSYGLPDEK